MSDPALHPCSRARISWSTTMGCEHDFSLRQAGTSPERPNPSDICVCCGSTRERAACVQRYMRSIGMEAPWGA